MLSPDVSYQGTPVTKLTFTEEVDAAYVKLRRSGRIHALTSHATLYSLIKNSLSRRVPSHTLQPVIDRLHSMLTSPPSGSGDVRMLCPNCKRILVDDTLGVDRCACGVLYNQICDKCNGSGAVCACSSLHDPHDLDDCLAHVPCTCTHGFTNHSTWQMYT